MILAPGYPSLNSWIAGQVKTALIGKTRIGQQGHIREAEAF